MPLLILLVVVPIVELYVLIQVGQAIGALPTIALMLATSAAGAWLLRREGAKAYRHFAEAAAAGRVPTREVADGALVLIGGILLLVPGFVSDALGLLLLLPPTRALLRRSATAFVARACSAPAGPGCDSRAAGGPVGATAASSRARSCATSRTTHLRARPLRIADRSSDLVCREPQTLSDPRLANVRSSGWLRRSSCPTDRP